MVDIAAFAKDLEALGNELRAGVGEADRAHFARMKRWGRTASALGWATSWMGPNPLSATLLALGASAKWTIVAHHTMHGGTAGFTKRAKGERPPAATFARGRRRFVDWLDWMDPDAWAHEHNVMHHGRTSETADPDLVEENMRAVRESRLPRAVRFGVVGFYACTWRLTYYAPNAWQALQRVRRRRRGEDVSEIAADDGSYASAFDPRTEEGRAFLVSLLQYVAGRYALPAVVAAPLGPLAQASVLANAAAAELLTNLHTFVLIAPNHAGEDVWRFDVAPRDRAEFMARQVLGTANYTGGTDVADFLQGFLNYQVEHHLWPDLPPLKYREARPRLRALCEQHGVPYVEEPIAARVKALLRIMVGDASMKRAKDARDALAKLDAAAGAAPESGVRTSELDAASAVG